MPWFSYQSLNPTKGVGPTRTSGDCSVSTPRDEAARGVGFDEGNKPEQWIEYLETRSIDVTLDILRDEAKAVLQKYVDEGGIIYNGRPSATPG